MRQAYAAYARRLKHAASLRRRVPPGGGCFEGGACAGLYFAAKQSSYFAVGKITQEQVDDYARRKGMPVADAERWLATMLNYEP